MDFIFPMTKLIDWEAQWTALENSNNVLALVVMAQLKAKRLREGMARKDAKVALIRLMYERGYTRERIQRLFNVIDWMIQLPQGLEPAFLQAIYAIEEEKHMPYINTAERLGMERGLEKGREEGRQEGRQEALQEAHAQMEASKRETARNLIARAKMNDQLIAEIVGLPVEEIAQLRREAQH